MDVAGLDLRLGIPRGRFCNEDGPAGTKCAVERTKEPRQELVWHVLDEEARDCAIPYPVRLPAPQVGHLELNLVCVCVESPPRRLEHFDRCIQSHQSLDPVDVALSPVGRTDPELDTRPSKRRERKRFLYISEVGAPSSVLLVAAVVIAGAVVDVVEPLRSLLVVGDLRVTDLL